MKNWGSKVASAAIAVLLALSTGIGAASADDIMSPASPTASTIVEPRPSEQSEAQESTPNATTTTATAEPSVSSQETQVVPTADPVPSNPSQQVTSTEAPPASNQAPTPIKACTARPVTDEMNVVVTPATDVQAWQQLKVTFSGKIADGHCGGDAFSFKIPKGLSPENGATYPMKDKNGNVVANMVVSGQTVTVTLTNYVETRTGIDLSGWLTAQKDASTKPGETVELVWDINGVTKKTPITMGECKGDCTSMPSTVTKWGKWDNGKLGVTIQTPTSSESNQVFTWKDTLTTSGQRFNCPIEPWGGYYTSRDEWGDPADFRSITPTVLFCTATEVIGTVTASAPGQAFRVGLPIEVTDTSLAAWEDKAEVTTLGKTGVITVEITRRDGGGSGTGKPVVIPPTTPPTTEPPVVTPTETPQPTETPTPTVTTTAPVVTPEPTTPAPTEQATVELAQTGFGGGVIVTVIVLLLAGTIFLFMARLRAPGRKH